jgi:hypothetical protein
VTGIVEGAHRTEERIMALAVGQTSVPEVAHLQGYI